MDFIRLPLRAGSVVLALGLLLAACPDALAAQQRLGRTTITQAVVDRFVASYTAAHAEERRRTPDTEMMDAMQLAEATERWEECQDSVLYRAATKAELATLERLQKAMQVHIANPQGPRAIALSDTATTLMQAIERRAEPQVHRACGVTPETRQEQMMEAAMTAPTFDVDSAAMTAMGLDGEEWGLLSERLNMFLVAENPKPNELWSAAEIRVLAANKRRLEAAIFGEAE